MTDSEETRSRIRIKVGDVEFEVEGKESMVKEFYEKFKKEDLDRLIKYSPTPEGTTSSTLEEESEENRLTIEQIESKILTLKLKDWVVNEPEWVLLYGYWINVGDKKQIFTRDDIKAKYEETERLNDSTKANLFNSIKSCVNDDYFDVKGKFKYCLTKKGKTEALAILNRTEPPPKKPTSRKKKEEEK